MKQQYQGEENGKLCSFSITSDMAKSKLQKLKMNKAPGVDSVGTRMLLELSEGFQTLLLNCLLKLWILGIFLLTGNLLMSQ